ncbi:hypothetical protein HispidOSU_027366 [Sigmodon hispidus]
MAALPPWPLSTTHDSDVSEPRPAVFAPGNGDTAARWRHGAATARLRCPEKGTASGKMAELPAIFPDSGLSGLERLREAISRFLCPEKGTASCKMAELPAFSSIQASPGWNVSDKRSPGSCARRRARLQSRWRNFRRFPRFRPLRDLTSPRSDLPVPVPGEGHGFSQDGGTSGVFPIPASPGWNVSEKRSLGSCARRRARLQLRWRNFRRFLDSGLSGFERLGEAITRFLCPEKGTASVKMAELPAIS